MYTEALRKNVVLPLEKATNQVFSQKYNPFYYHGALPNVFIWSLFATGLLLFAYYIPTLAKAYPAMEYITHQLPVGNAIRSGHRYSADGMMIFVLIHLFRVWFTDRYREYRIVPWITGVVLLAFTFIIGLTGYMLIWDQEAVTLTKVTLNLLRALPVFGPPLSSFFLDANGLMGDFTLVRTMFVHFGLSGALIFFLYLHYMRITRPVATPPFALIVLLFGGVMLMTGLFPIGLGAAPNLALNSHEIDINWLYLWPQALALSGVPVPVVWLLVLAVPAGLLALPYLYKKGLRGQFAHVIRGNCTGCSLCYHDCPYEAIEMVDRDEPGTRFKRLAVVDPGRCANCGLCVGACAFKAIEIPRRPSQDVLEEIRLSLTQQPSA